MLLSLRILQIDIAKKCDNIWIEKLSLTMVPFLKFMFSILEHLMADEIDGSTEKFIIHNS